MNDRERKLRDRLRRDPGDADLLRELAALVGAERGRKAEALEIWRRHVAAAMPADRPAALLALARAQVEARRSLEAIETLRECVAAAPESAEAFDILGELLRLSGAAEEAVDMLRRATELDPRAIRPRLALVTCLDALGRGAEADRELEGVRELGAGDPAVNALVMELMQRRE